MKSKIDVFMCIILLMGTTACHSYMDLTSLHEFDENKEKPNISVLQLQTNQYEIINFSERYPGRILTDEVAGIHHVILKRFESDSVIYKKGASMTPIYAVKDEVSYRIINEPTRSLVCISSDTLHIPLSDIKKMHIKKTELGESLLVFGGVAAGVAGLIYLIVINLTFDLEMGM